MPNDSRFSSPTPFYTILLFYNANLVRFFSVNVIVGYTLFFPGAADLGLLNRDEDATCVTKALYGDFDPVNVWLITYLDYR